ncbi:MAG TPA: hypothetical protein DCY64_04765 [Hydrogenophaga sp.]|uniref:hypothetical protein n=1 Tax=Hydrogenophaga sp. TaxID=1904254 RepID=UPI0008B7CE58|nr:hypothetical protein [Hydrogenophaga sp.]OGA77157.1 MAG: hypothetical protein A2X73_12290 [Burkholderiales bacterium GWE1_65_30]OGA90618.1 MAG: hypothetical protein A2X72_11655 [Burkholderiales bacterium GWF1_66_17]HAX19579.1 hypothetical protein [Hydrogenophaga sp.]
MKKIVLHVGMHKTGSTAIQASLAGYRDGVFEYAPLPPVVEVDRTHEYNHSFLINTAFDKDYKRTGKLLRVGVAACDFDRVRAHCRDALEACLRTSEAEVLILSAEAITNFDPDSTRELATLLHQYASDIQVYAYVRDPFDYVKAVTQEAIKWGHAGDDLHPLSYWDNFHHIEDAFGVERVAYRLYRREKLLNGDVIADFASWLGLKKEPAHRLEVNATLSTDAVRCIYALNSFPMFSSRNDLLHHAWRELLRVFGRLFPGRFEIPARLVTREIDIWDMGWMEARLGQSLQLPPYSEQDMDCTGLKDWLGRTTPEMLTVLRRELTDRGADVPENASFVELVSQLYLECIRNKSDLQLDYRKFSADRYLERNPDVRQAGLYPFGHYVLHGHGEGRDGS